MLTLLAVLIFLHFIFDYPLQGDFLSKAKNCENPISGVPWYQAMFAHTFMHAFAVTLVTGLFILGILEFIVHWITDYLKCKGIISFNTDQLIHILSKVLWVYLTFTLYGDPFSTAMMV